jgi:hypothetical protein
VYLGGIDFEADGSHGELLRVREDVPHIVQGNEAAESEGTERKGERCRL